MKIFATMMIVLMLWVSTASSQTPRFGFKTYQEMREHVVRLYENQQYMDVIMILEWGMQRFPDHMMANSYNMALAQTQLGRYEDAVTTLRHALDQDVWFSKHAFDDEIWAPLKEFEQFDTVLALSEKKRADAQELAKPELYVMTPEGYQKEKAYPLFIALHGGGGNVKDFKDNWKSTELQNKFIVAFPQSSQVIAMNGYNWTENIELSKKEISEAYEKVKSEYKIDTDRVIIGGFSSGGVLALEVAFGDVIPVSGFVVLCPAKPEGFTEEKVLAAKERGLRGTLLTTEMDRRLDSQKEMEEIFKKVGFEHRFIVTPDIGHWFPDDLNVQIDESIDHILK